MNQSNKAVALYKNGFIFVGHPVYEKIPECTNNILMGIEDVYQMIVTAIPGQGRNGQIGVAINITGIKLGKMVDIDENAIIVELDSSSQLYQSYVAVSTGIEKPM